MKRGFFSLLVLCLGGCRAVPDAALAQREAARAAAAQAEYWAIQAAQKLPTKTKSP